MCVSLLTPIPFAALQKAIFLVGYLVIQMLAPSYICGALKGGGTEKNLQIILGHSVCLSLLIIIMEQKQLSFRKCEQM